MEHRARFGPLLGVLLCLAPSVRCQELPELPADEPIPMTGPKIQAFASYDRLIPQFMKRWNIPGAAVAVTKDERLIFARGYGYQDVENKVPVQPNTKFRIASVSKLFTAAAVLQLVERDQLSLDQPVFELLTEYEPLPGKTRDPRLGKITVRMLLDHTGGWDRAKGPDPSSNHLMMMQAAKVPLPGDLATVIRFMMGEPLQFDPGTQYAYSNYGYLLLGRVIAKVSGQLYEDYVQENVIKPAGITGMKQARTKLEDRFADESKYYAQPGTPLRTSVFDATQKVPGPYGGSYREATDSYGSWLASPIDLVRFGAATDGEAYRRDIFNHETFELSKTRPAPPLPQDGAYYQGYGWMVRPQPDGGENRWHDGAIQGSSATFVHTSDGYCWAMTLNSWPTESTYFSELNSLLWNAIRGRTETPPPSFDMFLDKSSTGR